MAQNTNNNSGFKFSPWMSILLVLAVFFTISLFTNGLSLSNPAKTSLSKFNDFIEGGQVQKVTFIPDYSIQFYQLVHLPTKAKYIHIDTYGLSSARNIGIKLSDSDLLSILDDDAWVLEDYVKKVINKLKDRDTLVINIDDNIKIKCYEVIKKHDLYNSISTNKFKYKTNPNYFISWLYQNFT
jgi:hypothetical protein